jgi:hypothetical protein
LAVLKQSEFEFEIGRPRIIGTIKSGDWIIQAGPRRGSIEESPVEKRDFRKDRKIEWRQAAYVIAVNVHDIKITFDLLDERIE